MHAAIAAVVAIAVVMAVVWGYHQQCYSGFTNPCSMQGYIMPRIKPLFGHVQAKMIPTYL